MATLQRTGGSLILPFAANTDYLAGQAVTYQGQAWIANLPFTSASAFDDADWTRFPASVTLEYRGAWNASTNTPTLADGTGTAGYFYRVTVAGTVDLGSGAQTFEVDDAVQYEDGEWTKVPAA